MVQRGNSLEAVPMIAEMPPEHELIGFFDTEPTLLDPGVTVGLQHGHI